MWSRNLSSICKGNWRKWNISQKQTNVQFNMSTLVSMGMPIADFGKATLANDLASLIEESTEVDEKTPKTRVELKRLLELRIKKRVKERYANGKFHNLMQKVIANPNTLQDAYNCVRVDSNIDFDLEKDCVTFDSLAEELASGTFDVTTNVFRVSTKGSCKETLVQPNLSLRIVQEAIKVVLEVVFRPHFSKISHGCRSGRGHFSALRYLCKDISNADWWFTLAINKKLDANMLCILISAMGAKVDDPNLYAIIQSMFEAQVLNLEFGGFPKSHGLPQEGVLSPILMNIYLDQFDSECYKMSMRYEAIDKGFCHEHDDDSPSKLRSWFKRQMKDSNIKHICEGKPGVRIHFCRFMDEIFFAVSGSKDVALAFKSEMTSYLQDSLHFGDTQGEILSSRDPHGIRFLGTLVRRTVVESPAVRAVHKLKEKVELFALQKRESWNSGTVCIGKKWLAHGLKKVKESEIEHLADSSSVLSQISSFRKSGMETDHWYKILLKVWMQDMSANCADNEELILSKCISEPALPKELRDSFYQFQKRAEEYVSSETNSLAALLPKSDSSCESLFVTEVIAPVDNIEKRLLRYGLTNSKGIAISLRMLIMQDGIDIVDWFSGLASRLLRWYSKCQNFSEIKFIICNQVRKSCIRTLASKFRIHETEIEKKFDSELSRIPSTDELDTEVANELLNVQVSHNDEALMYGISYSGLCLLSLARIVGESRPCNCFVMGCSAAAPCVYTIHVMERQKYPGWKTGFSSCIHPSLNKRRIGLCKKHVKDLYMGFISLQSIDFGAWEKNFVNKVASS